MRNHGHNQAARRGYRRFPAGGDLRCTERGVVFDEKERSVNNFFDLGLACAIFSATIKG
jgi:tetrahydromethanopterin S-methyltransferase subunit E